MTCASVFATFVTVTSLSVADALARYPTAHLDMDFDEFVSSFGRTYSRGSADFAMREGLFHQTAARVRAQNTKKGQLWKASLNGLADRTWEELSDLRGWRHAGRHGAAQQALALHAKRKHSSGSAALAKAVDWRNLTSTKHIADQGACGSCWAVAAASMMEARHEIATNTVRTFSAQRLVDCTPNPKECGGSGGCKGATVELALEYVSGLKASRLASAEDAPYKGAEQQCADSSSSSAELIEEDEETRLVGSLSSWKTLPSNKAEPLMIALADGPVAVSVSAEMWFMYDEGIFDGCLRDAVIDHAVVMVGYGEDGGNKYWNIRNSWGEHWGEKGHIRLYRHSTIGEDDKFCGVDREPEKGMACKPYPDSVEVCGMCGVLYDSVIANFASSPHATK